MFAILFPQIDPVIIEIYGPIAIRWYGLAYVFGILLGGWLIICLSQRQNLFILNKKALDDLMYYSALGIMLGGRIGYILFYDLSTYLANPISMIQIWRGGMSFHGGLIGLMLSTHLFCKKHSIDFLRFTDLISCAAPIGLFFGRIANFINGELYGRITDVSWGMIFPEGGPLPRHPSQIYEAVLEGLLLFAIMMLFYKTDAKNQKGKLTGLFLLFYSMFRYIAEIYREGECIIWSCTMGQVLSFPMAVLGCYLIWRSAFGRRN